LGIDEDGDAIESCVVTEAPVPEEEPEEGRQTGRRGKGEKPAPKPARKPRGQNQQLVLSALRKALFDTPDARPEGLDAPVGAAVVTRKTWWDIARDALPQVDRKKAAEAFRDALEALVGNGFVGHHKREYFWEVED
jgi:hypothetical protein